MNELAQCARLVAVVRTIAIEQRAELEELKASQSELARPDFIWHFLLQSFATMGRASGWSGLIGNKANYTRITYDALSALNSATRTTQTRAVCRLAGIRMPDKKAEYILGCFDRVTALGGIESAKATLLAQPGRAAKIAFLETFPGIGPKYARNIMMDVYHEDFRDSIALDVRIKAITEALGLSFTTYDEHEQFYLRVAQQAGLNGWELDRLLFNFRPTVEARLRLTEPAVSEVVSPTASERSVPSRRAGRVSAGLSAANDNTQAGMYADWTPTAQAIAEHLLPLFAAHSAVYYPESRGRRIRVGWPSRPAPFLLGTLTPLLTGVRLTLRVGRDSALIGVDGPFSVDSHSDSGQMTFESVSSVPTTMDVYIARAVAFMRS